MKQMGFLVSSVVSCFVELKDKRVSGGWPGQVGRGLGAISEGARRAASRFPTPSRRRSCATRSLLLLDHGIAVETGGHGERTFRGQDLIVVSPGVPVDAPPLVQARALGEPVIGEIELAAQFLPGPIVAITGSNGKTTTTTLAGEIVTAAGVPDPGWRQHRHAGHFAGRGATSETVIVLKISSFQLETIQSFRPKVAVVLNITPDHLDRHRTFRPMWMQKPDF